MPNTRRTAEVGLIVLCVIVGFGSCAKPLYAYTDPGTGLMAIQVLGSMLAGFLFLVRKKVAELVVRLRKLVGTGPKQSP